MLALVSSDTPHYVFSNRSSKIVAGRARLMRQTNVERADIRAARRIWKTVAQVSGYLLAETLCIGAAH
jgi:hypothetical protein